MNIAHPGVGRAAGAIAGLVVVLVGFYFMRDVEPACFEAIRHGTVEDIRQAARQEKLLEETSRDGISALMLAAKLGRQDAVETLLELGGASGSSIDATDRDGFTALGYAVANGHLRIAEYLLAQGAEINVRDASGNTLLITAVLYGCKEGSSVRFDDYLGVIDWLLRQKGIDAAARGYGDKTAADYAEALKNPACRGRLSGAPARVKSTP
ncbi:MAG: ankyrin repeat domain-containing protein [Candidatus Schekmanbacteria bacterium]|nr:ankyrin repeat domain-containing protein [Candidatus Schekmanbacteria bacterium]